MNEDINVLEISTGKSVQNVRELKDYIKDLKAALDEVVRERMARK